MLSRGKRSAGLPSIPPGGRSASIGALLQPVDLALKLVDEPGREV
jgi:hypothetical protein